MPLSVVDDMTVEEFNGWVAYVSVLEKKRAGADERKGNGAGSRR